MKLYAFVYLIVTSKVLLSSAGNGFGRNSASSSPSSSRRGFSKISSPTPNLNKAKESLEVAIQRNIDGYPGLREAMAYYDGLDVDGIGSKESVLPTERSTSWSRARVHQKLLEITWDTSAGFRENRHQNSLISYENEHFLMEIAEHAVHHASDECRILDVGCGTGILMKFIKQYASMKRVPLKDENLFGVDLSSEMINICREKFPSSVFTNCDFLEYLPSNKFFSTVILNECLHNFMDTRQALRHAVSLLHQGGKLIISHPRGYSNILTQHRANKWLAPSILPSDSELERELTKELGLELVKSPKLKSNQYLAVLKTI